MACDQWIAAHDIASYFIIGIKSIMHFDDNISSSWWKMNICMTIAINRFHWYFRNSIKMPISAELSGYGATPPSNPRIDIDYIRYILIEFTYQIQGHYFPKNYISKQFQGKNKIKFLDWKSRLLLSFWCSNVICHRRKFLNKAVLWWYEDKTILALTLDKNDYDEIIYRHLSFWQH